MATNSATDAPASGPVASLGPGGGAHVVLECHGCRDVRLDPLGDADVAPAERDGQQADAASLVDDTGHRDAGRDHLEPTGTGALAELVRAPRDRLDHRIGPALA